MNFLRPFFIIKTMRTSILQFTPTTYPHLLHNETITYKGNVLKTSYLRDLMHVFIFRKYIHDRKYFNLWSVILRKKYGTHYNYYIDWLLDHNIISLKKKWRAGTSSKLYELTLDFKSNEIIRYPNTDKFLLRKINKHEKVEVKKLSPIYLEMLEDLKRVKLDYEKARLAIDNEHDVALIDVNSHLKNVMALTAIRDNIIYNTKDEYGRLHTNFTNLKKNIRNNFLTIDDKEIDCLDIKNCQPKLLAKIIKDNEKTLTPGLEAFILAVQSNAFYESFEKHKLEKKQIKKLVFQIFFGKNKNDKKNIAFKELWPDVWHWIVRLKKEKRNHKHLSHLLQKMESELIYDKICYEVKQNYPEIALFTVHDGIYFAKENLEKVKPIFDKFESQIIT